MNSEDPDNLDPLYKKAVDIVIKENKASAGLLQRKLSIGYARAVRIMDDLEENGVVGEAKGSKPREIIIK